MRGLALKRYLFLTSYDFFTLHLVLRVRTLSKLISESRRARVPLQEQILPP